MLSNLVMLVSLVGVLLVPIAVTAPLASASSSADRSADGSAARAADYVVQARDATNTARSRHGRHRVSANACLERAAAKQASRMARSGEVFHSPDFRAIGRRCGLRAWAENVAQAVGSDRGRGVVRQWMGSSGHRANILGSDYRLLGMGAVHARGSWWVVQVFGRAA